MDAAYALNEIIEDLTVLLKRAAHPIRGTLRVSPEVAEWVERSQAHEMPAPALASDEALATLAAEVETCTKCPLHQSRNRVVFGAGNPRAKLVFVGEAPGAQEDAQGIPFVGAAGQLLTRIIERGMRLTRDDVFICNVLKCRPPGNRDPRADEVEQCEPFLIRQLALIRPQVICTLGGHAAKTLLKTSESTGRLRGKWHSYEGIPLRVTYHPSYLLRCKDDEQRYLAERRKVWDDVQAIMRLLNGEESPLC